MTHDEFRARRLRAGGAQTMPAAEETAESEHDGVWIVIRSDKDADEARAKALKRLNRRVE